MSEKVARRLGYVYPHSPTAGGIAVDEPVLDGVVEDGGERVDELANRGRSERYDATAAGVADLSPRGQRLAQLVPLVAVRDRACVCNGAAG
jgi:hypothetical protein